MTFLNAAGIEALIPPPWKEGNPRRILVLEDDEEMTLIFDRILRSIDPYANIEWVTTAENVMASLRGYIKSRGRSPYDLIIADIFLEGKATGLDLLKVCQQHFSGVPLVITSGMAVDQFLASVEKGRPCPKFLRKPFAVQECREILADALQAGNQDREEERRGL